MQRGYAYRRGRIYWTKGLCELKSSVRREHVADGAARMPGGGRSPAIGRTMVGLALLLLALPCGSALCATRLASHTMPSGRSAAKRASLIRLSGAGVGERFTYKDENDRCVITMPIDEDVRSRDVEFSLARNVLTLGIKGAPLAIDAELLWGRVLADDAFWEISTSEVDAPRCIVLELKKRDMGRWEYLLKAQYAPPDDTPTVRTYMEIAVDGESVGRVEFGLFGNQVPRTVENFRCLCTGEKGMGAGGAPLSFVGSPFHRIIPGFMLQGGDTTSGDGTGGESIFGGKFEDESFGVRHERAGRLSMANSGPDSNGSQFFITVAPAPWLDGKHVVFGEVLAGMEVVRDIEALGTEEGKPSKQVTITACGVIP